MVDRVVMARLGRAKAAKCPFRVIVDRGSREEDESGLKEVTVRKGGKGPGAQKGKAEDGGKRLRGTAESRARAPLSVLLP